MALVFCDDDIDKERKQKMVKSLSKPGNFSRAVKANLTLEEIEANEVEDLVSAKSLKIFKACDQSTDFLSLPQATWMSKDWLY